MPGVPFDETGELLSELSQSVVEQERAAVLCSAHLAPGMGLGRLTFLRSEGCPCRGDWLSQDRSPIESARTKVVKGA